MLYKLYHIDQLNIGDICKKHGRSLGSIKARLIDKCIIDGLNKETYKKADTLIRGYVDFIESQDYKQMIIELDLKKEGQEQSWGKKRGRKPKNNITINDNPEFYGEYSELKQEIVNINDKLNELKQMIQSLAIYKPSRRHKS